jgi:hypothetical protein
MNPSAKGRPMPLTDDKLTLSELRDLFGDFLPMEAAMLLSDPSKNIFEVREGLRKIADAMLAERERKTNAD